MFKLRFGAWAMNLVTNTGCVVFHFTELCYLSNDIYDYVNVSQGKITIPHVDDGEEMTLTDVSS